MDTQQHISKLGDAKLLVLENDRIHTCHLETRPQWLVGRMDPGTQKAPDIPFSSPIVSREHGWIFKVSGQWFYSDNAGNRNGTFYNGRKIERPAPGKQNYIPLKEGDILRIDNSDLDHTNENGVLMLFTTAPGTEEWATFSLKNRYTTVIGRSQACDVVVPLPYISAKHAMIAWKNGQFLLSDCRSKAGTYLNGKAVASGTVLREKDCFSLCDCRFFFLGNKLLYSNRQKAYHNLVQTVPLLRPVVLKASIATKRVKNHNGNGLKELIRDIHLQIQEGTLVALLGTAGAGKTTVMNCLNGMDLEGVQGSVVYRNVDLMQHFDQMKSLIGSVPQQKVFHKTFTPEQEFRFAARKRLPADTTKQEIQERVDRTLTMLSMDNVRKNRNSKLSGGEQTRVNVGIELVADRDLLCLDEPEQGLSPNYKHELFEIMRNLAHKNGKSILTIIHDVSEIDMFDQVILLAKVDGVGRLAFSGTPAEARKYFGVDIRDAYALLEKDPKKYIG